MSGMFFAGNERWGRALPWLGLLLAFAIGVGVHAFLGFPASGIDDADITMVYARNLARGFGYVYQAGGERVEGSTSALWTFVCAAWFLIGESFRPLFLVATSFAGVACGAALVLSRSSSSRPAESVTMTLLLLGGAATFHGWASATLMDTALWSMLLTLTPLALTRAVDGKGFAAGALCLVGLMLGRPEAIALGPALVVATLLVALSGEAGSSPRARGMAVRHSALLLALAVIVVATTMAIRMAYFGFPLPNTYYAKMGSTHFHALRAGARYLVDFVRSSPHAFIVVVLLGAFGWLDGKRLVTRWRGGPSPLDSAARLRTLMAFTVACGFGLRLVEGGDHFSGFRVLQPFMPLGAALGGAVLSELTAQRERLTKATLAVLVLSVPIEWWAFSRTAGPGIAGEIHLGRTHREIAKVFINGSRGPRPPSLAVVVAGAIALDYPAPVYDLMGLNWTRMAHATRERSGLAGHASFSPDVFWEARPEVVLPELDRTMARTSLRSACDAYDAWYDEVLRGLLSSRRFRSEYRAAWIDWGNGQGIVRFFVRSDYPLAAHLPSATPLEWGPNSLDGECPKSPTGQ